MADASILSTGTWMIGFQRDLDPDKLDVTRAMVLNIDVDGENVPSTLTMTGREYHLISKEEGAADAVDGTDDEQMPERELVRHRENARERDGDGAKRVGGDHEMPPL